MKQIQQQQQEKVSVNIYACVNKTLKVRWKKNSDIKMTVFLSIRHKTVKLKD